MIGQDVNKVSETKIFQKKYVLCAQMAVNFKIKETEKVCEQ